jgi:CHAT domain-containing protein/Flp pilus assembly protein TadD
MDLNMKLSRYGFIVTAWISVCVCGDVCAQTWQELLAKADSLRNIAQYDSALALAQQAIEIAERQYGANDTSVARSCYAKGILCFDLGRYNDAEPLCRRALTIRENVLGPDAPDVAKTLNFLANICWAQGRLADAEPLHLRALAIRERVFGPDHLDVATSLGNLANLYFSQGRYEEAETLSVRMIAIREKLLGSEHPQVALGLNNLANIYWIQHRLNEAEQMSKRALEIREKVLGSGHLDVAQSLSNLANIYCDQGRFEDAASACQRALEIREKVLNPDHPDIATNLNNLANIYWLQGRLAEAEPLLERALEIREKLLSPDHPDIAQSLSNLANIYYDQGRLEDAASASERALSIHEKTMGLENPFAAQILNNLANIYWLQGRLQETQQLHWRALRIREKVLHADHPDIAQSLHNLATLSQDQGDFTQAVDLEARAWSIRRQNFHDGVTVLAERNALEYSRFLNTETGSYLSILLDAPDGFMINAEEIARVVFSSKSQVSDGIMERSRTAQWESDSDVAGLMDSLRQARSTLSGLYVSGLNGQTPEAFRNELQTATADKERLESELARRSASFRRDQASQNVTAASVNAALPTRACMVEFVKYEHRTSLTNTEPRFLAIVIGTGGEPQIFPLGAASVIDTAVSYYRQQFRNVQNLDQTAYAAAAENLYGLVWRPMAALLSGASTVFIAPDGMLNLVSFAGLVDDERKYLIENYPIQYLSTGRDLIRLQDEPSSGSGFLAMADPDFNMSYGLSTVSAVGLALMTGLNLRSSCEELDKLQVAALPATRNEVNAVSVQWQRNRTEPAITYFGSDATEEQFKSNAPGKRIIHLATHGFYITDECRPRPLVQSFGGVWQGDAGENPLLQCGFLLAGANQHGAGAAESGREDGIVTAEEVAGLNLQGADLVILSACESGLGEVKSGEGVYGLRRAFQMAGARTVISSLWPIDDKATAEFMGQLFSAQSDVTLPMMMQRVANGQIASLRSRGKSDHPFFWAAFVATGDWKIH